MLTAKTTKTFDPVSERSFTTPLQNTRAAALVAEHDDLDRAIAALLDASICDDLLITRLKKRKLQIKDEIALAMPDDHIAARATA
jgi:hypothetical protein